ncbi:hypothetical protein D3C73_1045080 [compost metagenome]
MRKARHQQDVLPPLRRWQHLRLFKGIQRDGGSATGRSRCLFGQPLTHVACLIIRRIEHDVGLLPELMLETAVALGFPLQFIVRFHLQLLLHAQVMDVVAVVHQGGLAVPADTGHQLNGNVRAVEDHHIQIVAVGRHPGVESGHAHALGTMHHLDARSLQRQRVLGIVVGVGRPEGDLASFLHQRLQHLAGRA